MKWEMSSIEQNTQIRFETAFRLYFTIIDKHPSQRKSSNAYNTTEEWQVLLILR